MSKSTTPSQRQLRAGELNRHALANIFLRGETSDPERLIQTVVDAQISTDVRIAAPVRPPAASSPAY